MMRKALVAAALLLLGAPAAASADGAFVNTVKATFEDGSTTRSHTVITPQGNFNFSQQDVVILGLNEQRRIVGAANFNENRDSGTFTQTDHFTGADVGQPAMAVMHDNFGPNGLKQFCHTNADLCP
jgi:predicted transglutaminase-like cysteine proteinase